MRLQGENGLLRQKFQSALTDVTQLQDQMKALETVKNSLQNVSIPVFIGHQDQGVAKSSFIFTAERHNLALSRFLSTQVWSAEEPKALLSHPTCSFLSPVQLMCTKVLDSLPLLLQKITDLEAECSSLKSDIRERDAKIHDRDQRISALKAESQQLAKFKFVLEYKLDEVKGQLEPKEAEIEDLNKKIEVDVHFESQGCWKYEDQGKLFTPVALKPK